MQEMWVQIPGWARPTGEGNVYSLWYSWPGTSHGQKTLVGYSPWGCRVWHDWVTNTFHCFFHFTITQLCLLEMLEPTALKIKPKCFTLAHRACTQSGPVHCPSPTLPAVPFALSALSSLGSPVHLASAHLLHFRDAFPIRHSWSVVTSVMALTVVVI